MFSAAIVPLLLTLIDYHASCTFAMDAALPPDLPGETVTLLKEGPTHRRYVAALSTGEFLDVQYSGCYHYGVTATIVIPFLVIHDVPAPTEVYAYVEKRLVELGAMALHPHDLEKVMSAVTRSPYAGGDERVDIPHELYQEFFYKIEETHRYYIVTIDYTFW